MTITQDHTKPDDFQDVEIETKYSDNRNFPFYIEKINFPTRTFILIFSFICLHILTAARAPPFITSNLSDFIPINRSAGNITIDLEIAITDLLPFHRHVSVHGFFARNENGQLNALKFPFEIMLMSKFLQNGTIVSSLTPGIAKQDVTFNERDVNSSSFLISQQDIQNFDTFDIKMSITGDFTYIDGIIFSWSFSNFTSAKYARISKILMSVFIAYMLFVFYSMFTLEPEKFTKILCIILGVLGVLSSNPLGMFFFDEPSDAHLSDYIFTAVFLNFFRFFMIMEIEIIRTKSSSPNMIMLFFASVFFLFYAILESCAGFDRGRLILASEMINSSVLKSEQYLMMMVGAYALFSIVLSILASIQSKDFSANRLHLIQFFILSCLLSNIVGNIIFPLLNFKMYTVLPSMIIGATHLTFAAFTIFFLHDGSEVEYAKVDNQEVNDGSLNIECVSDTGILNDNDLDEKDDQK